MLLSDSCYCFLFSNDSSALWSLNPSGNWLGKLAGPNAKVKSIPLNSSPRSFGQMTASRPTLSSQAQSLAQPVTRQGIDQRYNAQAVEYVKASFAQVMAQTDRKS